MDGRFLNQIRIITLHFRVGLTRGSMHVIISAGASSVEAGHKQAEKVGGQG